MFESRLAWRWKPAFVVLVLALGAPPGLATQVLEMTLSEIIARADAIAVGTVAAVEQTWDSGTGRPFTQVTLSDIDALKGDVEGGELTLRFLGGAAPGGLAVAVSGTPRFRMRERVVVFAARNGAGLWSLVGWTQGVYRVVREAGGDAPAVITDAGRRLTLDEFRILIKLVP